MFQIPERVYRTDDGRLVKHGDPEAAFLAFPEGDELSDEEAKRHGVLEFFGKGKPQAAAPEKAAARPVDKMVARPADKSRASSPKESE